MKTHLVNCTYCEHRSVILGNKKKNISEIERCSLTQLPIRHPSKPGRFCENFHQEGHDCLTCL